MSSSSTCPIAEELTSSDVYFYGTIVRLVLNTAGATGNLLFVVLLLSMSVLDATVKCLLVNVSSALAAYALITAVLSMEKIWLIVHGSACALETTASACLPRQAILQFITTGTLNVFLCAAVERVVQTKKLRSDVMNGREVKNPSVWYNALPTSLPWLISAVIVSVVSYISHNFITDLNVMSICPEMEFSLPDAVSGAMFAYFIATLLVPLTLFNYARRTSEKMRQKFMSHQNQQTLKTRVALKRSVAINHALFRMAGFQLLQWLISIILTIILQVIYSKNEAEFYVLQYCVVHVIPALCAQSQPIVCMMCHHGIRQKMASSPAPPNITCPIAAELAANNVYFYGMIIRSVMYTTGATGNLLFVVLLLSMSVLDTTVKCLLVNVSSALTAYAINAALLSMEKVWFIAIGDPCKLETSTHTCMPKQVAFYFITIGTVNAFVCASIERVVQTRKLRSDAIKNKEVNEPSACYNALPTCIPWLMSAITTTYLTYTSHNYVESSSDLALCHEMDMPLPYITRIEIMAYSLVALVTPMSHQHQQTLKTRVALRRSVAINHALFRMAVFQILQWLVSVILTIILQIVYPNKESHYYVLQYCVVHVIPSLFAQSQPIVCIMCHDGICQKFRNVLNMKSNKVHQLTTNKTADKDMYFNELAKAFELTVNKK